MIHHMHAREVGRQITVPIGFDWVAEGYTVKLRVQPLPGGTVRELPLGAISGRPLEAYHSTTRNSFPTAGTYRMWPIAFKSDGTEPDLIGDPEDHKVLG